MRTRVVAVVALVLVALLGHTTWQATRRRPMFVGVRYAETRYEIRYRITDYFGNESQEQRFEVNGDYVLELIGAAATVVVTPEPLAGKAGMWAEASTVTITRQGRERTYELTQARVPLLPTVLGGFLILVIGGGVLTWVVRRDRWRQVAMGR